MLNFCKSLLVAASIGVLATSFSAHAGGKADDDHHASFAAGVFLGATDTKYGWKETYGVEAFYCIDDKIAIGGGWEHLPDGGKGQEGNVLVGMVTYKVNKHFHLIAGTGKEYHKGHEKGLWRIGAAYDFHIGDYHISPTIEGDFMEDHNALVLGVIFGRHF